MMYVIALIIALASIAVIKQVPKSFGLSALFWLDECLTDPEDEVILDGVLGFASWGAQGTAGPLGALLLLTRGLPSSLCPLRGARGRGGVGCWVGCSGGRGGHLETTIEENELLTNMNVKCLANVHVNLKTFSTSFPKLGDGTPRRVGSFKSSSFLKV